jgi:hypothetical protein
LKLDVQINEGKDQIREKIEINEIKEEGDYRVDECDEAFGYDREVRIILGILRL